MPHPLELDARKNIHDVICSYPGIHFRELQRKTGMATGTLDYHLHFLHKSGLVRAEKTSGFVRYYNSLQAFSEQEKQMLSILRQKALRHIVVFLLQKRRATATEISLATGIQPSNLSAYLKLLEEKNVISHKKKGRFRFYQAIDKESIINCLVVHKKSFLDRIVDNFIAAWTEE